MALTVIQNKIYEQIVVNIKTTESPQIVYVSEWLGWFPFGAYHWINDCNGKDITSDFPSGWASSDIDALERVGLLKKISEWENPDDNFDRKITYDVILSEIFDQSSLGKEKRMDNTRKIILAGIVILIFFCLYEYLFDPLTPYLNRQKLDTLQIELNTAQEKWNSKNIRSYTYEVHYGNPMWGGCEAKITVKQGKQVRVTEIMHGGSNRLPTPVDLAYNQWDHDNCHYSSSTINEVFEKMQKLIQGNISLDIIFDQQYGFITEYYGRPTTVSKGLLTSSIISDSGFSYKLSNFQSMDVSAP